MASSGYFYEPVQVKTTTSISNRTLNTVAALLHLSQAVAVICLITFTENHSTKNDGMPLSKGQFQLYKQVASWNENDKLNDSTKLVQAHNQNFTIVLEEQQAGRIDVRYGILAFFLLSGLFQGWVSYATEGEEDFQCWSVTMRYLEYSISASVMVLCIAVETAVFQIYTLINMFVLTFVTMILGLLAQTLQTHGWLWLVPHLLGWLTIAAAYAPVLDSFLSAARGPVKPPDFVYCIVILEFALFMSFGFVQLHELWSGTVSMIEKGGRLDASISKAATRWFILLSLTAKTLLAWLILSPIVIDAVR